MMSSKMGPKDHRARAQRILESPWEQSSLESAILQAEAHRRLANAKEMGVPPTAEGGKLLKQATHALDYAYEISDDGVEAGLRLAVAKAQLAEDYARRYNARKHY